MRRLTLDAPKTLTVDVYPDTPQDLRRRLRHQEQQGVVSLMPGGLILEESPEALTYMLAGAHGWQPRQDAAGWVLESSEGHRLTLEDGRLTLTIAK